MALNIVWIAFFTIAFLVAVIKFIFVPGNTDIFKLLVDGIFDSAETSVMKVALPLTGVMVFFLGLMNIAEKAGAIRWLARLLNPFMKRLFPEVPDNHPVMGEMVMNFSANMLGLDNAATPFGLKAMQSLQSLNPDKETATNAQIMFAGLHTSGLVIIPLSIFAYRITAGSHDATSVFIPCVAGTAITTLATIIILSIKQKLKWDIVMAGWILSILAALTLLLLYVNSLAPADKNLFGTIAGSVSLLIIILAIIAGGVWKKVAVFDAFIDGAKNGFDVILKIIPYLVGMLIAIRVFRDSGALGYIVDGIGYAVKSIGLNTDFVPALPTAIMRPFSGAGSRALMLEAMNNPLYGGPDKFVGKLACTLMGSADTTFYIFALYFGSVGIKKVRYAVWTCIAADIIGVVAAIVIAYAFFQRP
jgi:spore maturation protein SpmA